MITLHATKAKSEMVYHIMQMLIKCGILVVVILLVNLSLQLKGSLSNWKVLSTTSWVEGNAIGNFDDICKSFVASWGDNGVCNNNYLNLFIY
jgi:hypothetical protein